MRWASARRHAPLLGDEFGGLRLENVERFVEVLIIAEGEPMRRRLDAWPFERPALDDFHGNVELPERGLNSREVHLAVALRGMPVARPQQSTLHEHRHEKGGPGRELADIHIASVTARWGTVL